MKASTFILLGIFFIGMGVTCFGSARIRYGALRFGHNAMMDAASISAGLCAFVGFVIFLGGVLEGDISVVLNAFSDIGMFEWLVMGGCFFGAACEFLVARYALPPRSFEERRERYLKAFLWGASGCLVFFLGTVKALS